jgi:hypothetical protein
MVSGSRSANPDLGLKQSKPANRKHQIRRKAKPSTKERTVGQWKTLDPSQILAGVAIVAAATGREVRSPRGYTSAEDLEDRLAPYATFAEVTLMAGAFDYRKTPEPTNALVIGVMIDFLRSIGAADASDELRLRSALLAPQNQELAEALRHKAGA